MLFQELLIINEKIYDLFCGEVTKNFPAIVQSLKYIQIPKNSLIQGRLIDSQKLLLTGIYCRQKDETLFNYHEWIYIVGGNKSITDEQWKFVTQHLEWTSYGVNLTRHYAENVIKIIFKLY